MGFLKQAVGVFTYYFQVSLNITCSFCKPLPQLVRREA